MGKLSQNPLQTVVLGVVLNFDELYLQARMDFLTKLKFYHQILRAPILAQSDESCKFWVENKRLPPPSVKYFDNHPHIGEQRNRAYVAKKMWKKIYDVFIRLQWRQTYLSHKL